jgi:hypothetical protein
MTKPNFVLERTKAIFSDESNRDIQNKIYLDYINRRDKETSKSCYCGHTVECDCDNPSFEEFKNNLLNNNINERNLFERRR